MENLVRRLKFYGIGFGIGLVFVFFFFKNRGCSWLPENRVKNAILDRVIVVSDESLEAFKKAKISEDALVNVLNDGDVLFSESEKDNEDKIYIIEKEGVKFAYTLPKESFISEIFPAKKVKGIKNTKVGYGKLLRFPMDQDLVFVDSNKRVTCQQNILHLVNPRDILKNLKATGKIDFERTNLIAEPKAEHFIVFQNQGKEIGANVIWYKNKLNITSFEIPGDTLCGN